MLYVGLDPSRTPDEKNLASVYQMLIRNSERQLTALFEKLPLDHPARAPYNLFAQSSDTVRSGIVLGLGTRLQVLQNEAVRSLGQLQNRYPNNLWAEIIGNTDVQLMLGCTDDVTAEYFSERSGDISIRISSTMTVRKTMAVAQVIPEYRQTQGQGKRRLLTPDEVLRLPNDELLVVIRGHNILRLKKLDYTRLPMSGEIVKTSLMDYAPEHVSAPTETKAPVAEEAAPRKRRGLYSSAKPPESF